ncbi:Biotin carboxylase OS=Stutzerimonas stutzeri OX=316 GN=accC PE=4 SV=1 [Stutzerimonas stutzeri]
MLQGRLRRGRRGISRCNPRRLGDRPCTRGPTFRRPTPRPAASAEAFLETCSPSRARAYRRARCWPTPSATPCDLFEPSLPIQRRNQKLIEIAPSPQLTPEQRAYIGDLAVKAAKAVGYENAGTVEFLLADGKVYFMEMNTRVQVEHTITEEITGIDIVREQIRIASGQPLSVKQEDIQYRGYALQFRINAEDPRNNFLPCFGKITRYYAPGGPGVRTDTAIYTGYTIPPYYDSMCLKLVVWALTWEEALARGSRALDDMRVQGVKTTATYYQQIPGQPGFPQRPVQHQLRR